jgi:hypothetical protein
MMSNNTNEDSNLSSTMSVPYEEENSNLSVPMSEGNETGLEQHEDFTLVSSPLCTKELVDTLGQKIITRMLFNLTELEKIYLMGKANDMNQNYNQININYQNSIQGKPQDEIDKLTQELNDKKNKVQVKYNRIKQHFESIGQLEAENFHSIVSGLLENIQNNINSYKSIPNLKIDQMLLGVLYRYISMSALMGQQEIPAFPEFITTYLVIFHPELTSDIDTNNEVQIYNEALFQEYLKNVQLVAMAKLQVDPFFTPFFISNADFYDIKK